MLEELRAFAKIAEMDQSARDYERELRELPERIDELRQNVSVLETMLLKEREQLTEAENIRDERTLDLKLKVEALQRAKAKGSQARNLREVDAAEREVDANRRGIKEREEEIATVDALIAEKTKVLEERDTQFQEARGILEGEVKAAEERLAELTTLRDKVLEGREQYIDTVPRRSMKMYERLRKRHKYEASTIIGRDGVCQSCRVALPAQLAINVQRAEEFYQCPQCNAFLIHSDIAAYVADGPSSEEE